MTQNAVAAKAKWHEMAVNGNVLKKPAFGYARKGPVVEASLPLGYTGGCLDPRRPVGRPKSDLTANRVAEWTWD